MKKIMDFLFGKKYPIYNPKGQIAHRWKEFMDKWGERYEKNENLNWKNHSGKSFQEKDKKSTL